jgi:hypothetical protein
MREFQVHALLLKTLVRRFQSSVDACICDLVCGSKSKGGAVPPEADLAREWWQNLSYGDQPSVSLQVEQNCINRQLLFVLTSQLVHGVEKEGMCCASENITRQMRKVEDFPAA